MSRQTTLKGDPLNLVGPELTVGSKAPDVTVRKDLKTNVSLLGSTAGKTRFISCVPSLDTPVCEKQTVTLTEKLASLPHVAFVTISVDLPVAQTRFCTSKNLPVDRLFIYSDYFDRSFGKAYGTLINELGVLCRAVFVVGPDDVLKYIQYVPEIADHPNYESALAAI